MFGCQPCTHGDHQISKEIRQNLRLYLRHDDYTDAHDSNHDVHTQNPAQVSEEGSHYSAEVACKTASIKMQGNIFEVSNYDHGEFSMFTYARQFGITCIAIILATLYNVIFLVANVAIRGGSREATKILLK